MASKFDKWFIEKPTQLLEGYGQMFMIEAKKKFKNSNLDGISAYFFKPFVFVPKKHVHKYDDYLFFMGSNPYDMDDMDAEWELCMGENEEVHKINKPTIVYVPAGVWHCPLRLVRVGKPVQWFHVIDHSMERKQSSK